LAKLHRKNTDLLYTNVATKKLHLWQHIIYVWKTENFFSSTKEDFFFFKARLKKQDKENETKRYMTQKKQSEEEREVKK